MESVDERTIGGAPAVDVVVTGLSGQRGSKYLNKRLDGAGAKCAAIVYNSFFSPVTPVGHTERLIFLAIGRRHFLIESLSPEPSEKTEQLLDSIKFGS